MKIRRLVSLFASLLFTSSALKIEAQVLNWTNRANLPQAAYVNGGRSFGVAALNDKIYLAGGLNFPSAIATFFEYDPVFNSWTQKANMLTNRYAPAAVALNGKLYAIGGQNNSGIVSSVEEYDPTSNTWTNRASMNQIRYAFQAVALNGKIYALGGQETGDAPLASVEEYDPTVDMWTFKANMPTPRASFGAVAINGKLYVVGGRMYDTFIPQVFSYDPDSNTWSTNASIPTPRETMAVVVANQRILAMGGSSPGLPRSTVEEYDPLSNVWVRKSDLPTSNRNECFGGVFDDTLYVFGGYDVWTMQAAKLAPILNFYTALELEFQTKTGKVYQLQASPDLITWTNFDSAITGDGNYWSKIYSTRGTAKLFFRFSETP